VQAALVGKAKLGHVVEHVDGVAAWVTGGNVGEERVQGLAVRPC
jgi:hypothetical protein